MKTNSESRIELRNLQILKKMLEKSSQFLPSGGCISGNTEVLKEHIPNLRTIAVEPYLVRNVSGGDTSGTHKLALGKRRTIALSRI